MYELVGQSRFARATPAPAGARALLEHSLDEAADALSALRADDAALDAIARAGDRIAGALERGGRVLACGNGGSMCDAQHFAEELTGRFREDRRALAGMALGTNAGHVTCVANDFGFDHVFEREVRAFGRAGDVLVAISTSGRSPNVLLAAQAARELGLTVVALTGRPDSPLAEWADVEVVTPGGSRWADRVQELHMKVVHVLCELVEQRLPAA